MKKTFLIFVILCATVSHAAISVVQRAHGRLTSGAGTISFTNPTVAGHAVIVVRIWEALNGATVFDDSDNGGNQYGNYGSGDLNNLSGSGFFTRVEMFQAFNPNGGTPISTALAMQTFTEAFTQGGPLLVDLWMFEVSGLVTTGTSGFSRSAYVPLDGVTPPASTTNPLVAAATNPSSTGLSEVLLIAGEIPLNSSTSVTSVDSPFTLETVQDGRGAAFEIVSPTTSYNFQASFRTGVSDTYSGFIITLQGTPGTSGSCPGIPSATALSACLSGVALAGGNAGWQVPTAPRLTITKASLADGTVGSAYSDTLSSVNGVPPLSWSIAFGSLPPGLSLNSVTGVVSGTPTASGTYNFTALVFDSTTPTAQTATKDMSISITCPSLSNTSPSPLPPATKGVNYSFRFQPQGGLLPLGWACTNLPAGLSCDATGLLSGIPTVAGAFTLTATVTDSCAPTPQIIPKNFDISVNGVVVINTATPLPNETVGVAVSIPFSANGGTAPYLWSFTGTLPAGLSLASDGTFSGTPTTAGTSTFTVKATDSVGAFTTKVFTVTVGCPPISVSSNATLPPGTQNAQYRFQFLSNGGVAPVFWGSTGTLPPGLALSAGGQLSGTPIVPGTFTFIVSVTDSCVTPQTATQNVTIVISNALLIVTNNPLPDLVVGQPASIPLQAQNGVPPYKWSTPAGPIPTGAVDMLDYWLLSDRTNFHMDGGSGNPRYSVLNAGLAMAIKSSGGMPQDGRWYDGDFLYFGTTDNGDAADQAACIAAGFLGGCFLDPSAYKIALNLRPFSPRYFVLGGPDVTINDPAPNMGVSTTNCGADNHTPRDLGNVAMVIHDAGSGTDWGGDVGSCHTVIANYYRSLTTLTPPYQSGSRERYYMCFPFGVFNYDSADWNGTSYGPPFQFQNLNNLKVAGGAPTPNFACGIPTPPVPGILPIGTTQTSSTSLNLKDSTGVISGTPAQSGSSAFTVQVEDSVRTIAQKDFTLNVTCPAFAIATTTVPTGAQGSPYNFTFQTTNGVNPVSFSESGTLPTGMTLSNIGTLSGTPVNFGTFLFTLTATDSCLPQASVKQAVFSLTINPNSGPLAFSTTSPLQGAFQGQQYSQQINVTGGTQPYTYAVTVGTLPAGLTMVSGKISGTPTTVGTSTFTVRVTDGIGTQITRVFSLTVSCQPITLVSSLTLPNGVPNQAYNPFQFVASGGVTPYSWTRTGGAFAAGMTFPTTGILSGTPTSSGSFSPIVQVADSCSTPQIISNTFSLTVAPAVVPLVITTPPTLQAGTVNAIYGSSLSATGGTQPYFWALTSASGTLPAGLTVNPNGTITGTPTTAGAYTPTIQVTDNVGATASQTFSITISCPALTIFGGSSATLPSGTVGAAFQYQFTSSGGIAPINWATISGSLPGGLTLSLAGKLSGTPTTSGTFTFTVQATDSCSTPQHPTQVVTIVINPAAIPLQIATPSLPSGIVGQSYLVTLSAVGGTPPYSNWIVSAGSLPTGLVLNTSTGVISGTPTVVQTTTPTIQVQDSVPNITTKAFTISITSPSTADNRYCNVNETTNFLVPTDGPATLPQRCVRTAIADTPASGPTKTVCASGCDFTTLQAAVNAASAGWIIKVKALTGATQNVFAGAAISGLHGTATNWIWIETDLSASLPAEGTRITPAWVGKPTIPGRPTYTQPATPGTYLPKIRGGNNTFTLTNSSFIRIIGLEFTTTSGTSVSNVTSGTTSDHIIYDRVACHGGDSPTWQDKDSVTRCFSWTGMTYSAIIDSYLPDTHCVVGGTCTDSQVVLAGGNSASPEGPFKFVDNFLETAAEPILFGGGGANAATTIPCDVEIRRNHMFKPLFWKVNDPSYFGTNMEVKNNLELKTGCRVLVEGNIFDTTWQGQADQKAFQFLMGNKNQSSAFGGTASSNGAGAITKVSGAFAFNSSQVSPLCAIPLHCNFKYNGIVYPTNTVIDGTHIIVGPNRTTGLLPPSSASASFLAFQPGQNPNATVHDITARFNRYMHSGNGYEIFVTPSDGGDVGKGEYNISIHDDLWDDVDGAKWCSYPSIANCGFAWSLALGQISNDTPAPNNLHDVTIKHLTGIVRDSFTSFPAGSIGPGIAFIHQSAPATSISNLKIYDNILPAGLILDQPGICSGGRIQPATTSFNCVTSVGGVGPSSGCFDHNALATTTATTGAIPNTSNNPPYPSTGPNCPFTVTGNPLAASYNAMQFTNLNGGIGGNYQLLVTSPYHNAASDGKDMGADVNAVNQATAGVQ